MANSDGPARLVTLPELLEEFHADQAARHAAFLQRGPEPPPPPPKRYRRHRCARKHRTYRTLAECIWPRAVWVAGEGPFACLAWCRVLTVTLWPDLEQARNAKRFIDASGCGGRCGGRHEIIELTPPAECQPEARR